MTQRFKSILLIAFLAGGLLLVRAGALPAWAWVLLTAVAIVVRTVANMDRLRDELYINDETITRRLASPVRRPSEEKVRWDDLVRVLLITHETGPGRRDMLFLLYGKDRAGVAVPGPVADAHALAGLLESRLPGFRGDQLDAARACPQRETFVLWEKDAHAA
jgi:hypothetical protein